MAKNYIQSALRKLNYSIGIGGVVILMYCVLLIEAWQPDEEDFSYQDFTFPWFFHALLGVGIALCAVAGLGHIAANTANFCCLSCYITIVLLLLILETATTSYVFMNPRWEKDFPSRKFDEFKDFVKTNDEVCKWVAWFILLTQGLCVLLATILRTHEPSEVDNYESEDEYSLPSTPLLSRSLRWPVGEGDPNIV